MEEECGGRGREGHREGSRQAGDERMGWGWRGTNIAIAATVRAETVRRIVPGTLDPFQGAVLVTVSDSARIRYTLTGGRLLVTDSVSSPHHEPNLAS